MSRIYVPHLSLHVYDKPVYTIRHDGTGGRVVVAPYFLVACIIETKSKTRETCSPFIYGVDFN